MTESAIANSTEIEGNKIVFMNLCFRVLAIVTIVACQQVSTWADPPATKTADGAKVVAKEKADAKKSPYTTKFTEMKGDWEVCSFGGDGEVTIKDKLITLDYGDPITGIRWDGPLLRDNYEIEFVGQRLDGFDFFGALTFPIGKKERASLVLGGWGGGTVGISSIDDRDASDNETTMFRNFKNNVWYKTRVRVEDSRIAVWIDDVLMFDHLRKDHTFDIRYEMDPCLPLGLANFQCKSQFKNIRIRKLDKSEIGAELISKKPESKDKKDDKAKAEKAAK